MEVMKVGNQTKGKKKSLVEQRANLQHIDQAQAFVALAVFLPVIPLSTSPLQVSKGKIGQRIRIFE
jgi:hypothetical protein